MRDLKRKFLFILIFFLAACFRFHNLNWDENHHLHPDERFLTMLGNAMIQPVSWSAYLDPQQSTFNPRNLGYDFYVYGSFPIILNKIIAIYLNHDNYNDFTVQGRFISATMDLLIIIFLYKSLELLSKHYQLDQSIKNWAIFLYALAVLPIQQAHFFTTDTFCNTFWVISFYYALKFHYQLRIRDLILVAIFFALAIASKISALYSLPMIMGIIFQTELIYCFNNVKKIAINKRIKQTAILNLLKKIIIKSIFIFSLIYFTLRFTDPYLFADHNFLNLKINPHFITNLQTLNSWLTKDSIFPPAIQWINKPIIIFPLINLIFYGIGIVVFYFFLIGLAYLIQLIKVNFIHYFNFFLILVWLLVFFCYQGIQFNPSMRYFLPLYPFICLISAFGINYCVQYGKKAIIKINLIICLIFLLLIWPLMFNSIYSHRQTRVLASEWIYQQVAGGSVIMNEHWDDALPLNLTDKYHRQYDIKMIPIFDPDTTSKWQTIKTELAQADYYILSSNRAWGSLPTVPTRYPLTTRFYQELFQENLGFIKVAEFTSYPSLEYLGIPLTLNDDLAEEAFSVYDHPKVIIFKKNYDL